MIGGGKSGIVNEATNQLANERLTAAVQEMQTSEYMKNRSVDPDDVLPSHRHLLPPKKTVDPLRGFKVHSSGDAKMDQDPDDDAEEDDDFELSSLRERRMLRMKREQAMAAEWRAKQHGTYREIGQDDFFATVVREKGGSSHCAVHFFHKDFERCKVMDSKMQDLCKTMMSCKFVCVDVEKCPFLVEKLKVSMLPCVVMFKNDVAVDRILGFEGLGDSESFDVSDLQRRLEEGFKEVEE